MIIKENGYPAGKHAVALNIWTQSNTLSEEDSSIWHYHWIWSRQTRKGTVKF